VGFCGFAGLRAQDVGAGYSGRGLLWKRPIRARILAHMGRTKLLVEEKAEELVAEVAVLMRKVRYPCKASRDSANSADSALLNIGEGIAFWAPKAKIAKYEIARGEAKEVQKALRALVLKGKLREQDVQKAHDIADHIIGMLTNMIKNLERRL
jgi:four helix bundle protein